MSQNATTDDVREVLRGAGLRATSARLAVLRTMLSVDRPLSHADVCARLRDFDRATVYRNLIDLTEAGLFRRSDIGDHIWRFELAEDAHANAHAHFVCNDCGTIECLPEDAVSLQAGRGLPAALDKPVEIQLRGTCQECA